MSPEFPSRSAKQVLTRQKIKKNKEHEMDILLAILISLAPLALAILGVGIVLRPPQSELTRNCLLWSFVLIGLFGVLSTGFHAYYTRVKAEAVSSTRRAIRYKLAGFVNEGLQLSNRCANESEPAPVAEANQWAERTEAFLCTNLDESYVARFRNSSGLLPLTANSISSIPHKDLWGGLYLRLARLNEFLEELSK